MGNNQAQPAPTNSDKSVWRTIKGDNQNPTETRTARNETEQNERTHCLTAEKTIDRRLSNSVHPPVSLSLICHGVLPYPAAVVVAAVAPIAPRRLLCRRSRVLAKVAMDNASSIRSLRTHASINCGTSSSSTSCAVLIG